MLTRAARAQRLRRITALCKTPCTQKKCQRLLERGCESTRVKPEDLLNMSEQQGRVGVVTPWSSSSQVLSSQPVSSAPNHERVVP